jgi:predicted outer membrane repeat protein
MVDTEVSIVGSSFEGCFSRGPGGAVMVSSRSGRVLVFESVFMACRSDGQGGALSFIDSSSVKLVNSLFVNNVASGFGGGALYAENVQLILHGVSAHNNAAAAGGGGVLFWLGQFPPVVIPWCREGAFPDPASVCDPSSCLTSCLPCQRGTYLTGSGAESQESCLPCEAGTYSSLHGAKYCVMCSAGYFSTTVGAMDPSVCAACDPGSYIGLTAATTCMLCEAGTYTSEMGLSTCLLCPAGTSMSSPGASLQQACIECPGGSFSQEAASLFCQPCSAGHYSGPMATTCTICPAGTSASASGSKECESCRPGQFSNHGADMCDSCSAGKFSTSFGSSSSESCWSCDSGLFSGRGYTRCLPIDGFREGVASNVFSDEISATQITLALPFPFHFYGDEYSNVTVSKHGLIGFGEPYLNGESYKFPHGTRDKSIIAVFWKRLAAPAGNGFIQWSDNNTITFQWTNWAIVYSKGGTLTFQVSLMRNGSVLLSYIELEGSHSQYTAVGLQRGDTWLTINPPLSANPRLYSGLCYLISPDPFNPAGYSVENYTCPENMRLVESCGPGLFLGPDYQCTLCPYGTYQTGKGMQSANSCLPYAPGTFPNHTMAADQSRKDNYSKPEMLGYAERKISRGIAVIHSNEIRANKLFHAMHDCPIYVRGGEQRELHRCLFHSVPFLVGATSP